MSISFFQNRVRAKRVHIGVLTNEPASLFCAVAAISIRKAVWQNQLISTPNGSSALSIEDIYGGRSGDRAAFSRPSAERIVRAGGIEVDDLQSGTSVAIGEDSASVVVTGWPSSS